MASNTTYGVLMTRGANAFQFWVRSGSLSSVESVERSDSAIQLFKDYRER